MAAGGQIGTRRAALVAGMLAFAPVPAPAQAPLPHTKPAAAPAAPAALPLPRPRPTPEEAAQAEAALPTVPPVAPPEIVEPEPPTPAEFALGMPVDTAATDPAAMLPHPRPRDGPAAFKATGEIRPGVASTAGGLRTAFIAPRLPDGLRRPAADGDNASCRSRLAALGVKYTLATGIQTAGACGVAGPMNVAELGSGISLAPEAVMNCRVTEALARWAREVVVPAARRHLHAAPTGIVHASTYVCRTRNNEPGAKLSEHATGNAVDIASIGFDGRPPVEIGSKPASEPAEQAFQDEIRRGACQYFTTVLGPGSDSAHATHFHFDMAQRRGGYRLCK